MVFNARWSMMMHFVLAITNACDGVKWVGVWLLWVVN